jgi:hypothetical protein
VIPQSTAVARSLAEGVSLFDARLGRRRRGGEHVFLEVNPSGQWLGFEERTGQPITRALARLLADGR